MVSLPSELKDAKALFSEFEKFLSDLKHQDINKKLRDQNFREFKRAHDIVRTYLRDNTTSDNVETAKQLRITYTRRVLEELPEIPPLLEEEWRDVYIELFSMRDDLEPLFEQKPTLRKTHDDFRTQYPEYRRHLHDWLLEGIDDPEIRRKVTSFLLQKEENVV